MCNLYSMTKSQQAIREFTQATVDNAGNLPPLPAIYPDYMAPIVRAGNDGAREIVMMRWGLPGPAQFGGAPVTNVRNTTSPYWRRWLGTGHRCIVPATSFCEWEDTKPKKTLTWFALAADRPLFAFAGIWTSWHGTRGPKAEPVIGEHSLFGFLTTSPNAVVAPVHPKAMPVILTTREEIETWLTGSWAEAAKLQRPLREEQLQIVDRGPRSDPA